MILLRAGQVNQLHILNLFTSRYTILIPFSFPLIFMRCFLAVDYAYAFRFLYEKISCRDSGVSNMLENNL